MNRLRAFLYSGVLLVSVQSLAERREPARTTLAKNGYVKIAFGYDQTDEFHFQKKSAKVWIATWVDREKTKAELKLKRAFPAEIAAEELEEFESILLRLTPKISAHLDVACASKLNLEAGSASGDPKKKIKLFCLDGLSRAEVGQIGVWINSMKKLF